MSRLRAALVPLLILFASGCVDTTPLSDEELGLASGGAKSSGDDCGQLAELEEPVVLAYIPTWVGWDGLLETMDYESLTHIAIAFANPPEGGGALRFEGKSDDDIAALVTRAHENDVQVLVSIAGAAESYIIAEEIVPSEVDGFVEELVDFVAKYELDGVDVDIEGSSVDSSTYGPFVRKLSERLRPEGKLVTAAVAKWFEPEVPNEALFCFDFLNIMSYDLLLWDSSGPVAAEHSTMSDARSELLLWTAGRGYPKERTVLGVPFYGYCWGSGCDDSGWYDDRGGQMRYSTIEERFPELVDKDYHELEDMTLSLNSASTIEQKTRLGLEFGGVMLWDISQDSADEELFSALRRGLE